GSSAEQTFGEVIWRCTENSYSPRAVERPFHTNESPKEEVATLGDSNEASTCLRAVDRPSIRIRSFRAHALRGRPAWSSKVRMGLGCRAAGYWRQDRPCGA